MASWETGQKTAIRESPMQASQEAVSCRQQLAFLWRWPGAHTHPQPADSCHLQTLSHCNTVWQSM